jgi:hypothetical protein
VTPLVQEAKDPESSLQAKVPPPSLAEKPNVGVGSFVNVVGFDVSDTVGATVSTVQLTSLVMLVLPSPSRALTWNVCGPSARLL